MTKDIRTRFAPSPTGYLHVGGVRTAIFAWALARQNGGQFILRLEDTDKNREHAGTDQHIAKSLSEIGLDWDEGFDIGGPYGPYRQSDRLDIYHKWAKKLLASGRAYADPYTTEEVQSFRDQAIANKKPYLYRNHRPENPPKWDGTMPLRFKSDPKSYKWNDAVMGDLSTGPEVVEDFVLIKSDGYPTYNFAHIVDDAEMRISHIIRGQEFISSQPNYLNLYEALEVTPPVIATVPHILGPTGNKKLSKRDGAKDVLDYIKDGYLPDAMFSFLATLGWNDGTEQEIFTRSEVVERFSLNRVQRSGARFDERRLLWTNGYFIRELSIDQLEPMVESYWPESAKKVSSEYRRAVLSLVQERMKFFAELPELTNFFFERPEPDLKLITDNKKLSKVPKSQIDEILQSVTIHLEEINFTLENIQGVLNQLLEELDLKPVILFSLVRVATTWSPASPALAESLFVLGKEESLARLNQATDAIKKLSEIKP